MSIIEINNVRHVKHPISKQMGEPYRASRCQFAGEPSAMRDVRSRSDCPLRIASSEATPPYGCTEFLAPKNRLTEADKREVEDSLNFVSELKDRSATPPPI
jgi:hypothetical protein